LDGRKNIKGKVENSGVGLKEASGYASGGIVMKRKGHVFVVLQSLSSSWAGAVF